jgi:HK97 family phage prohead protease
MRPSIETRVAAAKRQIEARSINGIQRRALPFKLQVRSAADGGYQIVGHGAVYNSLSGDLGGFKEMIAPGFFDQVMRQSPDVKLLFNHDPSLILAATPNGSLQLQLDNVGLGYNGSVSPAIAATYYGQAMRAQLSDGLVTQSSFAFSIGANGDSWDDDPTTGELIRTLMPNGCSGLYDCSPVTYPAYPAADSQLASTTNHRGTAARVTPHLDVLHHWMAGEMRKGHA